jgi:hypothetical protein
MKRRFKKMEECKMVLKRLAKAPAREFSYNSIGEMSKEFLRLPYVGVEPDERDYEKQTFAEFVKVYNDQFLADLQMECEDDPDEAFAHVCNGIEFFAQHLHNSIQHNSLLRRFLKIPYNEFIMTIQEMDIGFVELGDKKLENLDVSVTVGDVFRSLYRKIKTAWSPALPIGEYQGSVLSAYSSIYNRIFYMLYVAFSRDNYM